VLSFILGVDCIRRASTWAVGGGRKWARWWFYKLKKQPAKQTTQVWLVLNVEFNCLFMYLCVRTWRKIRSADMGDKTSFARHMSSRM